MTTWTKLGDIQMGQCTALGHDRSGETRVYVAAGYEGDNDLATGRREDMDYATRHIGYYLIHHPAIMAGAWEDVYADMCNAAERQYIADYPTTVNRYGVVFAA